jgi:hypothetical protein
MKQYLRRLPILDVNPDIHTSGRLYPIQKLTGRTKMLTLAFHPDLMMDLWLSTTKPVASYDLKVTPNVVDCLLGLKMSDFSYTLYEIGYIS